MTGGKWGVWVGEGASVASGFLEWFGSGTRAAVKPSASHRSSLKRRPRSTKRWTILKESADGFNQSHTRPGLRSSLNSADCFTENHRGLFPSLKRANSLYTSRADAKPAPVRVHHIRALDATSSGSRMHLVPVRCVLLWVCLFTIKLDVAIIRSPEIEFLMMSVKGLPLDSGVWSEVFPRVPYDVSISVTPASTCSQTLPAARPLSLQLARVCH